MGIQSDQEIVQLIGTEDFIQKKLDAALDECPQIQSQDSALK